MFYFVIVLCLATIITITPASEAKKHKSADVENFLDKILHSNKFDELAEKIAEKAADRIVAIAKARHFRQDSDKGSGSKENEKEHKTTKVHKHKQQDSSSGEFKKEVPDVPINIKSEQTSSTLTTTEILTTYETVNTPDPSQKRIDTIGAIQKFAASDVGELSLNIKHFTAKHSKKAKHVSKPKKMVSVAMTHHTHHHDKHKGLKDIKNRTDHKKRASSSKEKSTKTVTKGESATATVKKAISQESISESGSGSSNSYESPSSEENNTVTTLKVEYTSTSTTEKAIKIDKTPIKVKVDKDSVSDKKDFPIRSIEKTKSNEISAQVHSSQEDIVSRSMESDVNQVSQSEDEFDSSQNHILTRPRAEDNELENKTLTTSSRVTMKPSTVTTVSTAKTVTPDDKLDLKHKIRELNGKLYAFAQDPAYDEYHEKVKELIRSARNSSKEVDINRDLLDLVEQ